MTVKRPPSKTLAAICRENLQALAEATPGILSAAIVTTEGCEVAAVPHGKLSSAKLAEMTSLIHKFGEALLAETGVMEGQHIMIEARAGKVIMLAIPGSEYGLLLAVIAANQAILSHLLWACRNCCNTVAKELGGNDLAKLGIQR